MNLVINWNASAEIIDGWRTPNWYGILFISGLLLGYYVIKKMFNQEQIGEQKLEKLTYYVILATIIGARLGHVLFYGPYHDYVDACGVQQQGYFDHPLTIFYVWEGGLASHGGAIALLIALYLYSKKELQKPFLWILDRIAAPIAIAGTFIRLGNLVNHEIVGDPTNVPWAFSFSHFYNELTCNYDPTPRHPAQLYESICYLISFVILMYVYWKRKGYEKPGFVFGLFLILIFTARFFVEFIKLGQTERDAHLFLNTGQLLSIPFVLTGVYLLVRAFRKVN